MGLLVEQEYPRAAAPTIDQISTMVRDAWPSLHEKGIGPERDKIVSAAAVGLVEKMWRNSPVEDAHASRRGPSDGEMMAQSLHLHTVAVRELSRTSGGSAVLAFERYVLAFDLPWHGSPRTVKDMLWGHLGEFRRHAKGQTNTLLWLEDEAGPDTLLGFLCLFTRYYGTHHVGMPVWPQLASDAIGHLSRPDDPCWQGRHAGAQERIRASYAGTWPELEQSLRHSPQKLAPELLQALIGTSVLHFGERVLLGLCSPDMAADQVARSSPLLNEATPRT